MVDRFTLARSLIAGVAACALACPAAEAQQSKTTLNSYNNGHFVTNGVGSITGPVVNTMNSDFIASFCGLASAADCVLPSGVVAAQLGFTPAPTGTTVGASAHVATTALLAAASSATYPNGVWRDDYASASFLGTIAAAFDVGSAAADNDGSGYVAGDVGKTVTVSGGTCVIQPTLMIASIGSGDVTGWIVANPGDCSALPSNPAATTGGGTTGSGASAALTSANMLALTASSLSGTIAAGQTIQWSGAPSATAILSGSGLNWVLPAFSKVTAAAATATGSGYVAGDVGDTVTVSGDICPTPVTLTIASVSGGQVTGWTVANGGVCSSAPGNGAMTNGGGTAGQGATVNPTTALISETISSPAAMTAANGAPALFFSAQIGACAANGLVSDGGGCQNSSDGNSFVAHHPATGADLRAWGAAPGINIDAAIDASIAWACQTHIPIVAPFPATPYKIATPHVIGNGSLNQYSTCNGVTFEVNQHYPENTSGTGPKMLPSFLWMGVAGVIPFTLQGPAMALSIKGVGINCNDVCSTGLVVNNIMRPNIERIGVTKQIGNCIIFTSVPNNIWAGALEGGDFRDLDCSQAGPGGGGLVVGSSTCTLGTCADSLTNDLFENILVDYDASAGSTACGLTLGFVADSTFINLNVIDLPAGTAGHSVCILPPPGANWFPDNLTFVHPRMGGPLPVDPGAGWTGAQGFTLVAWDTTTSAVPSSVDLKLWHGTDAGGSVYPSGSCTLSDGSGATATATAAWTTASSTFTVSAALNPTPPVNSQVYDQTNSSVVGLYASSTSSAPFTVTLQANAAVASAGVADSLWFQTAGGHAVATATAAWTTASNTFTVSAALDPTPSVNSQVYDQTNSSVVGLYASSTTVSPFTVTLQANAAVASAGAADSLQFQTAAGPLALTSTACQWYKIGQRCYVTYNVTYPSTTDSYAAKIAGLPCASVGGLLSPDGQPPAWTNYGSMQVLVNGTANTFQAYSPTGVGLTNVGLTGKNIKGDLNYLTSQ